MLNLSAIFKEYHWEYEDINEPCLKKALTGTLKLDAGCLPLWRYNKPKIMEKASWGSTRVLYLTVRDLTVALEVAIPVLNKRFNRQNPYPSSIKQALVRLKYLEVNGRFNLSNCCQWEWLLKRQAWAEWMQIPKLAGSNSAKTWGRVDSHP